MQEWQNEDTEASTRNMNLWFCVFWKHTDDIKPSCCIQKVEPNFFLSLALICAKYYSITVCTLNIN